MVTVSFSMSDELIGQLDDFANEHDYAGRSAMLRETARTFFEETSEETLGDRRLVGVVMVLFDYGVTGVEDRLTRLRHEHDDLVVANVHDHTRSRHCLELFVIEGRLDALSAFVETVRSMTGPLVVTHSVTPIDDP